MRTRSPSLAWIVGPGALPLNPQRSKVRPGMTACFTGSAIRLKTFTPLSMVKGRSSTSGVSTGGGAPVAGSGACACCADASCETATPAPTVNIFLKKFLRAFMILRLSNIAADGLACAFQTRRQRPVAPFAREGAAAVRAERRKARFEGWRSRARIGVPAATGHATEGNARPITEKIRPSRRRAYPSLQCCQGMSVRSRKPAGRQPGLFDEGKAQLSDCLALRAGGDDREFRQREKFQRQYKARRCRAPRTAY